MMRIFGGFKRTTALVIVAIVCIGCGAGDELLKKRASVSGKVTLDGTPVDDGRIVFTPTGTEGSVAGAEIKAGAYSIPREQGPVAGPHKVMITAMRKTGQQREAPVPAPPGQKIDVKVESIPEKYNVQSTLTADLKAGANKDVDFTMTKE